MADRLEINYQALKLRKIIGVDEDSPIDIFSLFNDYPELTLVFYPFSERISGLCYRNTKANLIAINSSMTLGRQRFSLAHELFHLFYDTNEKSISSSDLESNDEIEIKANIFASYFLAPYSSLRFEIEKMNKKIEFEDILYLNNIYKMSYGAMAYRLLCDGYINRKEYEKLSKTKNIVKKANELGYDINIYLKNDNNTKITYGNYLKQVNELKKKKMISDGKAKELLLTAFRDDIVFNHNKESVIND